MQALSVVALVLSIFLLLSTITTLVNEQIQVIGTMKAIGGSRGKVLRTYLTTVAIYGVIGTILGLALGVLVGYLLVNVFGKVVTLDIGPLIVSPSVITYKCHRRHRCALARGAAADFPGHTHHRAAGDRWLRPGMAHLKRGQVGQGNGACLWLRAADRPAWRAQPVSASAPAPC